MTDHNEAMRLADALVKAYPHIYTGLAPSAASLLRQQAEQIAELEGELKATSDKLQDLQSTFDYVRERRAQIYHRLWVWAHEELSEPLKTRYFNIVANGTADVMEQPTYAQQYNAQKHRADAAEAERDQLRAEVERLRADAERWHVANLTAETAWKHPDHRSQEENTAFSAYRCAVEDGLNFEGAVDAAVAAIDHARTTHKETE